MSVNRNGTKLTVSRKKAKILAVNRESHHPIETLLHGPLQMLSPENGVCNYLALAKINDVLFLQIRAFLPPEL